MKKNVIVSLILASSIMLAGPKKDLQKADELYKQNKVEEAIKILEKSKLVNGEEEEYKKIKEILVSNYIIKLENSKNNTEKIKNLEKINEILEYKDLQALASLNSLYVLEKNNKKVSEMEVLASKNFENQSYNIAFAAALIDKDYNAAYKYVDKDLKSNNPNLIANANIFLIEYNVKNKKQKEADKLEKKLISTFKDNEVILFTLANIYMNNQNNEKAYNYLKESYYISSKKTENKELTFRLLTNMIVISQEEKRYKDVDKWAATVRNLDDSINNEFLSKTFYQAEKLDLAKKFGIKSLNKNSTDIYVVLLNIALLENNEKDIKKYKENIEKMDNKDLKKVVYSNLVQYYADKYNEKEASLNLEKLKKVASKDELTNLDDVELLISKIAFNKQDYSVALENAKKVSKRSHKADLVLSLIYLNQSDVDNALKYAKSAVENNVDVEQAKNIIEQIELLNKDK